MVRNKSKLMSQRRSNRQNLAVTHCLLHLANQHISQLWAKFCVLLTGSKEEDLEIL